MNTLNRTVLLITPKQPYIDWANSFDDGGPSLSAGQASPSAILIPDTYDEHNYENWLKKHYKDIFLVELESWMIVPESYPKQTYKVFRKWFDVLVADTVFEFGSEPIIMEEY